MSAEEYRYRVVTRHMRVVVSAECRNLEQANALVEELDVTFWNDRPHYVQRKRIVPWETLEAQQPGKPEAKPYDYSVTARIIEREAP